LAKTRSKVSWLEMPLGSSRNRRKESILDRPYLAMSSHPLAPAMTAQVTITKMSVSLWSLSAVSIRGSGRSAKRLSAATASGILLMPSV
jgi:hypothetical protein